MTEFFLNIHGYILDSDRLPVIILAVLLTAVVGAVTGPSHGNANPWFWMLVDKIFGPVGSRLDRKGRRPADLVFRGFFLTLIVVLFSYGIGIFASYITHMMPLYGIMDVLLLAVVMTCGSVWYALLKLFFAMRGPDKKRDKKREKTLEKGAYYAIARSARTDLSGADDYTITRTAMSYAVRSLDKGMVGPALWYLLFGLPGAFLYAGLAALVWRFGRDGQTAGFGRVALALEKLMGFVPMIFSGALVALAGLFTPTAGMTRALAGQIFGGKGRTLYEEGGLPVTALAYSLDVSLGGPVPDLDGYMIKRGWVGPKQATARLEPVHLQRALYICFMAQLLFVAALLGAMLWGGAIF